MSTARGVSRLGCLLGLLVLAAAAYFGIHVGEPYVRYLRYRDAMEQEARFAERLDDETIRRRLRARADSLGLPPDAGTVVVRRTDRRIEIWADYGEPIALPLLVRELRFRPHVARAF